jgi:hypothetical protein
MGRIQKRKTNFLQIVIFALQRAAGPYRWAMYGRRPQCKRNLTLCEAFGCSHVSGLFSHEGVTSIAMQPLWPLALM